jgi:hypothetical protein
MRPAPLPLEVLTLSMSSATSESLLSSMLSNPGDTQCLPPASST